VPLLVGLAIPPAGLGAGRPDDHGAYYVDHWGLADPVKEPLVARAQGLFERVRRAASLPAQRTARLLVIAARSNPWAIALPDGHIVLSRGAVETCYPDADPDLGDARLAFVLGHELAHLAKDDFWHGEVHRALMGDPAAHATKDLLESASDADPRKRPEHRRLKEAQADDWGFVYAAVAGYPVHRLLGQGDGAARPGGPGFFHFWLEQTQDGAADDPTHPAPRIAPPCFRTAWPTPWRTWSCGGSGYA
jgi:hypothetical protein